MDAIPGISNNNGFWEGKIILDVWRAFFELDRDIDLNIGGDIIVNKIETHHTAGYRYLIANQESILDAVLSELMKVYPQMQLEYGYESVEKANYMPDVLHKDDLKTIIKPQKVYILDIVKNGTPYIGFQFFCTWDDEHGFGAMMHECSIIKTGGADSSFMSWIAEEDLINA